MKTDTWIEWVEPFGPNNEPVYMRVEESTAIAHQRRLHEYKSDAEALADFKTVHWATSTTEPVLDGEHWQALEDWPDEAFGKAMALSLLDLRKAVRRSPTSHCFSCKAPYPYHYGECEAARRGQPKP